MATCRDCELFLLAKGIKDRDGLRNAFCPVRNVTVKASDNACLRYRSAYEGVFIKIPEHN